MIEQLIREKIKNFFKEYSCVEEEENHLIFKFGDSILSIEILSGKEILDRNAVLNSALKALAKFEYSNKVYLALPKVYASIIDGEILQNHGLGLLTYDEKEVKEVIPAKFIKKHLTSIENYEEKIEELKIELKKIKENYMLLKNTVDTLKSEVEKLKVNLIKAPLVKEEKIIEVKHKPKLEVTTSGLPSFFKDNPWLEVLAKRGKEPETYGS
ncbi:MAG: hypothetical protein QW476_00810 [Candidatus Bathyarchaeia archaeon]|nr:hypothetical protein [Candidatus Bathyarchaeota archaeon]